MLTLRRVRVPAFALLIAAAVLYFCTRSSPAYPINDWSDANIYLTIGKGITRGQVMYRDLYDHKGPLLYMLHAACAMISFDGFLGVYLMETAFAAAFLCCVYRLLKLYGAERMAWLMLPVIAFVVYSPHSFSEGDSAEELCMPLLACSMCHGLAFLRSGHTRMSVRGLVAEGVLAGCVFWIKFTLIGVHAGLLLCLVLMPLARRKWREALRAAGWLLMGVAISTLPWLAYFGLNGAICDWLKTYLYDNLFLYGAEASGLGARVRAMAVCGLEWLAGNLRYTLLILLGLGWFWLNKRRLAWERAAVWLAAGLGALSIFIGGKDYPYYGQGLAPLAALGLVPICLWLKKPLGALTRRQFAALCALACALSVGLCPLLCRNMTTDEGVQFGQAREETMQYQFAARIAETPDATLLNYGFMDAGFYTAAGLVPTVKYFHLNNVPLQEMRDEQNRYVDEALTDYVVTRGGGPESLERNYELIATASSPGYWYESVYLYRRRASAADETEGLK